VPSRQALPHDRHRPGAEHPAGPGRKAASAQARSSSRPSSTPTMPATRVPSPRL